MAKIVPGRSQAASEFIHIQQSDPATVSLTTIPIPSRHPIPSLTLSSLVIHYFSIAHGSHEMSR